MQNRLPVIFFGHGSPMNALVQNRYSEVWHRLGQTVAKPAVILCVSAHWYVNETAVTAMDEPPTIHDFGGFPEELYKVEYPAKGSPQLAARVHQLLAPVETRLDKDWGMDHGSWSVLVHAYAEADVPVVQLSIDRTKPAAFHYELARRLAPLRDEGVLITASGNVVHNLRAIRWAKNAEPYDWAVRFNQQVKDCLLQREFAPLIAYETLGEDARLAIPTPDHYLPLLYAMALHEDGEPISFAVDGIDLGSISMLTVVFGMDCNTETGRADS